MGKNQVSLLLCVLICTLFLARASIGQSLYVGTNSTPETNIFSSGTTTYDSIYIGTISTASNNSLQISNTGTTLIDTNINTGIFIGYYGSANNMTIAAGATQQNYGYAWIGGNYADASSSTASNNSVLVTGSSSSWFNGQDLTVGVYGAGNSLIISNGGSVNNNHYAWVGGNAYGTNGDYNGDANSATSSNNNVVVTGNGSRWNIGYDLTIGVYGSGNTMNILDGAQVAVQGNGWIGGNGVYPNSDSTNSSTASNNTVVVSGSNSLWSNGGDLIVGLYGPNNSLIISNGGVVRDNYGWIGGNSSYGDPQSSTSSNNSIVITGNGSMWSNGQDISIGIYGGGNTVTISDGGQLQDVNGWIGGGWTNNGITSSNNSVLVTGSNSIWNNAGMLTIGSYTAGNSLVISNGGAVIVSGDGVIGGNENDTNNNLSSTAASNSVLVTGSNSSWNIQGSLIVGAYGAGNTMTIADGGQVTNQYGRAWIGGEVYGVSNPASVTSSNNSVVVTGSNSTWYAGSILTIGCYSSGNSLMIQNGGTVFSTADSDDNYQSPWGTWIGGNAFGDAPNSYMASNNSVLVSGAGSLWSNGGDIGIGVYGTGNTMVVSNGGHVMNAGSGWIGGDGYNANDTSSTASNNSVLVTGLDSLWSNAGNLTVGVYGAGNSLVISSNAQVFSSNGVIGLYATSLSNSVTVNSGGLWSNSGILSIGSSSNAGSGSLLVDGSGSRVLAQSIAINNGTLQIGSNADSAALGNAIMTLNNSSQVRSAATLNLLASFTMDTLNWGYGYVALFSSNASISTSGSLAVNTLNVISGGGIFDFSYYSASGTNVVLSASNGISNTFQAYSYGTLDTNWSFSNNGNTLEAIFTQATYSSSDLYVGSNTSGNVVDFYTGTNSYDNTYVGYATNASSNVLNVANSGTVLSNSGNLYVGDEGSGNIMSIFNGGQVFDAQGSIGFTNSSSSNSVFVSGAGSLWSNSDDLTIGVYGAGNSLTISNGGQVFSSNGWIGGNQNHQDMNTCSNNLVLVTGTDSLWSNGGALNVGFIGGNNQLIISEGGEVIVDNNSADSFIGNGSSNNTVLVTDTNSVWSNGGNLYIGGAGVGNQLIISNGGTVYIGGTDASILGNGGGSSNNMAVVTGTNSLWSNAGDLSVGYNGSSNQLIVSNGGVVISPNGYVGNVGNSNSAIITGSNSLWSNSGSLTVGVYGAGNSLIISNGGQVYAGQFLNGGNIWIGGDGVNSDASSFTASNNNVLVTGQGSILVSYGDITVGVYGAGNTLTISDGGLVESYSNIWIGGNGVGEGGDPNSFTASNNSVVVSGTNSEVFSLVALENLGVGLYGAGNSLNISNGGAVLFGGSNNTISYALLIGSGSTASNNSVFVTGSNSALGSYSSNSYIYVGLDGSGNSLTLADGGVVASAFLSIGNNVGSSNNSLNIGSFGGTDTAGLLLIYDTISFGSGSNGAINFNQTDIFTLTSPISGNGLVNQFGTGTTILAGSNSYGGITTINQGTLEATSTNALGTSEVILGGAGATNTNSPGTLLLATNLTIASLVWGSNGWLAPNTTTNPPLELLTIEGFMSNAGGGGSMYFGNYSTVGTSTVIGFGSQSGFSVGDFQAVYSNGVVDTNWSFDLTSSTVQAIFTQSIDTNTDLYVGSNTSGNVVDLYTAGSYNYNNTYIGYTTNASNNILNVANVGVVLNNTNDLYVGDGGAGNTMNIFNGGVINDTNGHIGFEGTSSNNSVYVTGGATWNNSFSLTVGENGSGNTLVISNGTVNAPTLFIGGNEAGATSSNNTVIVTGSNAVLNDNYRIKVGFGNGNTLIAANGATINAGSFFAIGEGAGSSSNTVILTGSNTTLTSALNLVVGDFDGSYNKLIIAQGAHASVTANVYDSCVGVGGYSNTALVTDLGSAWILTDQLGVGAGGSFSILTISNGGIVSDLTGYLGSNGGTNNSVLVTGTGSLWSNNSNLIIGVDASGNSVTIADGASVVVASNIIIGASSTSSDNSLNFGALGGSDSAGSLVASSIIFGNGSNGAINFNQTNNLTLTSTITGSGSLNQLGRGTTIISSSNNYNGTTLIQNGTLVAANQSALGTSGVILQGTATTKGILSLSNNLTIESLTWGSNGILAPDPGVTALTVTGTMSNSGGGGTFKFDPLSAGNATNILINFGSQSGFTSDSYSISGFSGYTFIQTASNVSGYLSTNADLVVSDNYTINNNTAHVSSLTIAPRGSVNGTGNLNANLINEGHLAPGVPTGTLTVNGSFTCYPKGVLQINVASPTSYGQLQVNGNVNLGGTLEVAPIGNIPLFYGEQLTFLNSTGPIKGNFNTVQIDQSGCRGRVQIIGDPQAIVLIAPTSYTLVAQNQNQMNVAAALDSLIPATSSDAQTVSAALDFLTAEQYPAAFEQIMPTLYQSLSTIAFNIDNAQNQEIIQRLWGVRLASAQEAGGNFQMSGFTDNTACLQEKDKKEIKNDIMRPAPNNHWGMFVDGNGIFAQANSANNLSTYNAESGGVTTGLSYRWNKTVTTGIYAGYQGVYSKYNAGSTLIDDQVNFGLFGTYGEENGQGLFIDGLAGGAYDNYQMNRNISFGSGDYALNRTAMGAPGAGELNTMVATGYDLKRGNFTFGPLSSIQYQYFGAQSFSETGAQALNLNVNAWDTSSLIFSLGSHVAYNWQATKNLLVIPQISLSWQHQFLENPYTINSTLNYGNSPTFANTSSVPLRDTLYTGIGVTMEFAKRWDTSFFYNAAAGNQDVVSQNIFWSLGYKF
ncbi:MAG: autotransporter-associated beta strand repeat-containing protein [Chthoniobacterales bacterium]